MYVHMWSVCSILFCHLKSHFSFSESKLNNHAHNGAPESSKISPPELSLDIPEISQLSFLSTNWENVELPVDILLFTVRKEEFLSCFGFLKNPVMRSSRGCIGIVYFSSMEDEQGNKIKIALMRCSKGHDGPGGALSAAKDAIFLLRPKVLFSVGACNGVNRSKVKLGDVVVSSKLKIHGYLISPMRNINNLISNIGDGWKAPLQNANGYKPEIHSGVFLCVSEANNDIISRCTEAIAVEKEGGGENHNDYKDELGTFQQCIKFPLPFLTCGLWEVISKRLFWNYVCWSKK